MSDDKKLQIKRAILSELNKELAKKTNKLSKTIQPSAKRHETNGATAQPSKFDVQPKAVSAKFHKPRQPMSSRYNAQPFVDKAPSRPNTIKQTSQHRPKKRVHIPQPTPRTIHPVHHTNETLTLHKDECVRKYAELWRSKTFGPSMELFTKAKLCYQTKVLQSSLAKWKDMTYAKQVEWKLIVRADCHYRFYLKERYWDTWRTFLSHNKTMSVKKQKADEFCSQMLLKRYLKKMRNAVAFRKDYNASKSVAQSLHERNLSKNMLNLWHRAMADRSILHERENIALHFWSLSLQRQCLVQWIYYKNQHILKKDIKHIVSTFYQRKLLQRSLRYLMIYRQRRKVKEILARKADKLLKSKLRHKFFYQWHEQMFISEKTRLLEHQICWLQKKSICRRMLLNWQGYCNIIAYEKELVCIADHHAKQRLLHLTLSALKLYNQHQKHTKELNIIADAARENNLLRMHFSTWVRKFDEAEENKLKFRTLMARKHYENKIARLALEKWIDYKEYRHDRKECYDIADTHHQTSITQLMFTNWHLYVCYRKTVKIKKDTAGLHQEELLYHKYFYTWVRMFHMSRNLRQDERIALLHYDQVVVTKFFVKWRHLNALHQADNVNIGKAYHHFTSKLVNKVLLAFSLNKEEQRQKLHLNEKASLHYNKKQLSKCYAAWNLHIGDKRISNENKQQADEHYNLKLLSSQFRCWSQYHTIINKAKQTISGVQTSYNRKYLLKCLRQWVLEVKLHKIASDLNFRAEVHYEHKLTTKVLSAWLSYTEQRAKDHVNKIIMLDEGREHLDRLTQKQVLLHWRRRAVTVQEDRRKCSTAEDHFNNKLVMKSLAQFKANVELTFKKKVLARKLENFRLDYTLKPAFLKWRLFYGEKLDQHVRTEKALWFWCVALEYRVLRAWISYTQYRKQKELLYREALDDRRKYLIETGVRQWIGSVTTAEHLRTETALIAATQQTYRANELAVKWGKHWYNTVKKRARKRSQPLLGKGKENELLTFPSHKTCLSEQTPKFYENFKTLKNSRPAPKIPSFFVEKQYYS